MTNRVTKLICHAEFTCARCQNLYECMAVAPVMFWPGGAFILNGEPRQCGSVICPDCMEKDSKAERKAWNKSRQQKAWVTRAKRKAAIGEGK